MTSLGEPCPTATLPLPQSNSTSLNKAVSFEAILVRLWSSNSKPHGKPSEPPENASVTAAALSSVVVPSRHRSWSCHLRSKMTSLGTMAFPCDFKHNGKGRKKMD
ncbi:DUF2934 domain-containing protein [Sesbania bispinosa]|nr:DUF2934 domain-containing protein [Sesbania bispinosa]